jgi:S-adenosyl-L-methionine hydrolase (adenosine-forming)
MRRITFLTDFGTKDAYVAQMKGVISSITDVRFIDITHEITPHNIREGAFLLWTTAPYFPDGTIHIAVVDPGVGTQRKSLVIATKKQILLGPDNGLLLPAAHQLGDFVVYEITNPKYMIHPLSRTFHGRDIFSPVAGYIARGVPFREFGPQTTDYVDLQFALGEHQGDKIIGKIMYVDRFGNLITNIPNTLLPIDSEAKKTLTVCSGEKRWELPYVPSYGFVNPGDWLITIGSSHFLELSVSHGNASQVMGLKEDADIQIHL